MVGVIAKVSKRFLRCNNLMAKFAEKNGELTTESLIRASRPFEKEWSRDASAKNVEEYRSCLDNMDAEWLHASTATKR